jgi:hypothetical protein
MKILHWFGMTASCSLASLCASEISPPALVVEKTRASVELLAALERPGKVLFEDSFDEESSLEKYFELRGRAEKRAMIDLSEGQSHRGKGALRLTAANAQGKESGAGATAWLGDEGHDVVHLRYYIRFADDYKQGNLNHTGGSISAVAGSNKWRGMGQAGKRPQGDDYFNSRFETWCDWQRLDPPGYLFLYTYWMEMQQDKDSNYWGNMLEPEKAQRFLPERGKWYCLEHMIRANTPGKHDGELAAWIDGKLYLHFTGIQWRSSEQVKIKRIDLGVYVHACTQDNTVWYDDVVVSTGYIGPVK